MDINKLEIQKPFLFSAFFWFAGMVTLATWNAVLSQNGYWCVKLQAGVDAFYPFVYFGGAVLNFFVYDLINSMISFKMQVIMIPCTQLVSFVAMFITCETMEAGTTAKLVVFQVICFIVGFVNNTLQTSVNKFCFNFRPKDITAMTSGTGLIGIVCAAIGLITNFTLPDSPLWQYIIYQIYLTIFVGFSVVIFWLFIDFYYTKALINKKSDNYYSGDNKVDTLKSSNDALSEDLVGPISYAKPQMLEKNLMENNSTTNTMSEKVIDVINVGSERETWAERCVCFKDLFSMVFLVIQTYSTTLSIFPSLVFKNELMPAGPSGGFALVVLLYNIGDTIGKYIYNWIPLKDNVVLLIYVLLRSTIMPAYYLLVACNVFEDYLRHWWLNYIVLVILSASNGHITSGAFNLAADRLEGANKRFAGFFMVMSLLLGQMNGSMISALCQM